MQREGMGIQEVQEVVEGKEQDRATDQGPASFNQ